MAAFRCSKASLLPPLPDISSWSKASNMPLAPLPLPAAAGGSAAACCCPTCRPDSSSLLSPSLSVLLPLSASLASLLLSSVLPLLSLLLDPLSMLALSLPLLSEVLLLLAEGLLLPSLAGAAGCCACSAQSGAFQETSRRGGFHSAATAILSSCRAQHSVAAHAQRHLQAPLQLPGGHCCGKLRCAPAQASAVESCPPLSLAQPTAHLPCWLRCSHAHCLLGCRAQKPLGLHPPPPAHSTRQLAWKTTGLRSHGDASSSSTAGCRQWMKCRRLLTAALHPAGPRVTEVANHMSGAGAWGPLGQMGSSAENARQLREYGAGSVQVGLTRRGKAGPRLAPRSRTALTGWSNHVQLLVALAPQAHHQPPKTGESGGITGKGRSQPRTCRANAANGKNAGVASGGARTMLGCAQCHGFRLHAGPRGSNMASSCVQQRRWPRADVEVQGELSLAPRIRHAQWAAAATASCLAGFCAPEPGEQTLRGH